MTELNFARSQSSPPTPVDPATSFERQLDIDLIAVSGPFTAVPGGGEVELAHMVIGSGNSEIRLPIRLKRQGSMYEPGGAYDTWIDSQPGRPHVIPDVTQSGGRIVLPVSLKVSCNILNNLCLVKIRDNAVTPPSHIMSRMVAIPPGASVALEFGMKAGYTSSIPDRIRFFRPHNF